MGRISVRRWRKGKGNIMLQVKDIKYTVRNTMGNKTKFQLQHIDFELEQGYFMCLLGKNGAGKSTLLRLLYGVHVPESGQTLWNGKNVVKEKVQVRQEVAYVGEEEVFFEERSLEENVEVLQGLYPGFERELFTNYLESFELGAEALKKKIAEFSTGQKKQIQLAFALARKPKLLLLDEPMANLDPVFRVEFMDLLQQLISKEEVTVILSTHILDDVEELCDYVGVIDQGEMKLFGDRERILEQKESLREIL